jgi:hypothetical protein
MEQTCHHIWLHDTHHTSDHLKHRASPQPVIDVSYIITESKENPIPYMRYDQSLCTRIPTFQSLYAQK